MWIIWAAFVVALILTIISIVTDEPGYFFVGASILVAVIAVYFVNAAKDDYSAPNHYCLDAGYTEPYLKGDAWYCLDFGIEPRIIRVPDDVINSESE